MPAKGFLSQEQQKKLQKELKKQEHAEVRERILILLLLNDGKTQREIANFLGCSLRKIAYWCVHDDPENLESLKDKRMSGNHHKATEEYIDLLLKIVDQDPEELGYEFGRWTAKRLATYLNEKTGIKLSSSQIRRILAKKKYVYLWAKYSLEDKQDPEKRKLLKKKLEEYISISKEKPKLLQIWFWDESGFSLRVLRRKLWGKKGSRKKITGQRRKGRVNVTGAVRYSDKKRVVDFVPKGDGNNFYLTLKVLYQEVKNEWIQQCHASEDFESKGTKILVILDNASCHKKEDILNKIEGEMPNLVLEFLPTYSPDYNIAELVWHSAKEFLAHRLFKSVEQLEFLLHRLLNQGELIINWDRKLKNKGNIISAI
ncbi:MAG: IS630 family transposase [Pleurocapsa sp.]